MPANYGVPTNLSVYGPNGGASVQIAPDWADLMNPATALERTLNSTGISDWRWRSFSNTDGSLNAGNCTGGTGAGVARYGNANNVGTRWINDNVTVCTDTYRLLLRLLLK